MFLNWRKTVKPNWRIWIKLSLLHLLWLLSDTLKTELNRETTMYCSPYSSKFFGTPCIIKGILHRFRFKDVRGWQFLTMKAAETLWIVCLPPEEHFSWKKYLGNWPSKKSHFIRVWPSNLHFYGYFKSSKIFSKCIIR